MGYYDRFHLLFSSPGQRPCPLLPSPKQHYVGYYDRFQLLFSSPGQRPCPLLPSPKQHYVGYYDRFQLLFSSPDQRPCPLLPSPKQHYVGYYDRFQLLFSSPGQRPCPLLPSPKQHYMGYYDRFQLWDIDLIFGMWVYTDKLQIKFTFRSGPMIFGRVVDWNLTKYLVVITFFRYAWRYWLDFYTPTHRVVGILEYPCPSVPKPCVRN